MLAILFVFRNAYAVISGSNNGNYDLLYIVAVFVLFRMAISKRTELKKVVFMFLPFVGLVVFETIFSPVALNIEKTAITLGKTFLCILILSWVRSWILNISIDLFISYVTKLLIILTVFAFVFNKSFLWIHNDTVNVYSKTRLRLFFLEPTYLSLFIAIILAYIFYRVLESGKIGKTYLWVSISLIIILLLSAGMGGIGTLALAVVVILGCRSFKDFYKGKTNIWLFLCIIIIPIAAVVLLMSDLPIVQRLFAVIAGKDSSFNYRFVKGSLGMENFLKYTNGIGIGMGCLNTEIGHSFLNGWNIEAVIVSSLMYFVAENGYLGLAYLIFAGGYLLYKSRKSIYLLALWAMILVYQLLGGYFTDPLCWCCYGIILANPVTGSNEIKRKKKIKIKW